MQVQSYLPILSSLLSTWVPTLVGSKSVRPSMFVCLPRLSDFIKPANSTLSNTNADPASVQDNYSKSGKSHPQLGTTTVLARLFGIMGDDFPNARERHFLPDWDGWDAAPAQRFFVHIVR